MDLLYIKIQNPVLILINKKQETETHVGDEEKQEILI